MLTEEEARSKWCPFARDMLSAGGNRTAYGGGEEDGPESEDSARQFAAEMAAAHPCIASDCMAWRWATKPNPDYRPSNMMATWPPHTETPSMIHDGEHGYCGLAGIPRP